MESKLEFEYKKSKSPINIVLLRMGLSLVYLTIIFFLYDVKDLFAIYSTALFFLFSILIIDILRVISYRKKRKEKALSISVQNIFFQFDNVQVDWKEVQDIKYEIRMVSSFMLVDVKGGIDYIKKQKWYKRPKLYLNNWKFKTPLVVNLEKVEGETDENYKKIKNFIKAHSLLSFPQ